MPIKGVSEIRRLPRLGKIRLGIKVQGDRNPYPRATDYFVVPDEIKPFVNEKPKQLKIMFPVEDPGVFAPQFMKCYSMMQGLVCRGDGVMAKRKVDKDSGDVASHLTKEWTWSELSCNPDGCPQAIGDPEENIRPQCRRVMNLMFILPDVPGLGVWQLDTSSFYSIVNINSCVDVIAGLCGRISGIPLTLSLEPREVTPPGMKKKTIQVLHLRSDLKLSQLQSLAIKAPAKHLAMEEPEEEEAPEDLYPDETLQETETHMVENHTEDHPMTKEQAKRIKQLMEEKNYSQSEVKVWCQARYEVESSKELKGKQAGELIDRMEAGEMLDPEEAIFQEGLF